LYPEISSAQDYLGYEREAEQSVSQTECKILEACYGRKLEIKIV
jgi:hypothetical protein